MENFHTERRDSFVPLLIIIAALTAMIVVLNMIAQGNDAARKEQTTAVYKGYLLKGKYGRYPIIEINGEEYISDISQSARDSSYVGQTVIIKYRENNINDFRIIWDETELSE